MSEEEKASATLLERIMYGYLWVVGCYLHWRLVLAVTAAYLVGTAVVQFVRYAKKR